MNDETDPRTGYAAGLGAYLTWGLLPLYWKLIDIPAIQVTLWRMFQAALLMTAIVWWRERVSPRQLFADRRASLVHLLAALLIGGNWFVFVYAIGTDRIVETSLGYFINPLVSVGLGMAFLGESLTRVQWTAVVVAVVGVLILTVEAGTLPWISLVLSLSFGFYGLVRKTSSRSSFQGLTQEMLWLLPVSSVALGTLALTGRIEGGGGVSVGAMCFLGVATALPLVLFATAARNLPLSVVGMMQYIAPSLQLLIGAYVFNETVTGGRWLGIGVIWLALIILASGSIRTYRAQR